jgi:hypothetical protein
VANLPPRNLLGAVLLVVLAVWAIATAWFLHRPNPGQRTWPLRLTLTLAGVGAIGFGGGSKSHHLWSAGRPLSYYAWQLRTASASSSCTATSPTAGEPRFGRLRRRATEREDECRDDRVHSKHWAFSTRIPRPSTILAFHRTLRRCDSTGVAFLRPGDLGAVPGRGVADGGFGIGRIGQDPAASVLVACSSTTNVAPRQFGVKH